MSRAAMNKRGGSAAGSNSTPRGNASRAVSILGRSAAVVLGVGVLGGVAGFATIPFLGHSPENPFADLAVAFLGPGLLISLALWILYSTLPQVWVDKSGNWITTTNKRDSAFRIAASLPLGFLALGVAVLGFAPLSDFVPWINDLFEHYLGPVAIGLVLLSVVIAAVAGAMVMGGWRAAVVGLVFGFGFVATIFGQYTEDGTWTVIGWSALALALAGFYLVGAVSGHLPRHFRDRFGSPGALVLGAVVALIGFLTGQWLLGLFGAGSAAAWLGIRVARRWGPPVARSRNADD